MADGKNHEMGKKAQSRIKSNPSSVFSRSVTINSSAAAAAENKLLYNLSNSQAFHRNGSVKSLSGASFGSIASAGNSFKGKVWKLCSTFESSKHNSSSTFDSQSESSPKPVKLSHTPSDYSNVMSESAYFSVPDSPIRLPGTEDRVVIYFTSLRGIRRTFHDCHSVRMIFRGFHVNIDERDICMDCAYRKELQKLVGKNNVSLPQVFIKGKYIGGVDIIMQLLESGELAKMIKGLPLSSLQPCDACGDVRFVLCLNCNGSRKVFDEDEKQIARCPDCNENGLMRCPICSS